MTPADSIEQPQTGGARSNWLTGLLALIFLLLFLAGVRGLGNGFKLLGSDLLEGFFAATANPLVALMVGILATTLVQSSSVSTSMIVGLVAAPDNPLPIANAVPMVMGANIGTTVTNTAVALVHMARRDEFKRAFAVATCHDFFNYLAVLVMLPLELATGFLSKTAAAIAANVSGSGGVEYGNPLKSLLNVILTPIDAIAEAVASQGGPFQGGVVAVLSVALIIFALLSLVRTLRSALQREVAEKIENVVGRSGLVGIAIGAVVTMMVQSSSITTSLLVPLAGAGVLTLQQAFPITLGANIGTTLTALLATLAVTGPNAHLGVTIALVHTLFNATGTVLIYTPQPIRRIPLWAAERLAEIASKSRYWAIAYVVILFYGIPALFAWFN